MPSEPEFECEEKPELPGTDSCQNDLGVTAPSIRRLAELFVEGKIPFPKDLPSSSQELLRRAVREQARRRIVQAIARAVARDLLAAHRRAGDQADAKTRLQSSIELQGGPLFEDVLRQTESEES